MPKNCVLISQPWAAAALADPAAPVVTVHPADLGAHTLNALMERTGIDPGAVDDVVMGCLDTIGSQAGDIARTAWLAAGQELQRLLLTAVTQGLQASYLNQPAQVAWLRPALQQLTGRTGHAQLLLRLGTPLHHPAAASRRPTIEVMVDA